MADDAGQDAERNRSDGQWQQSISKALGMIELDRVARLQRTGQFGSPHWLDTDNLNLRFEGRRRGRNSRDQAAAAHWYQNGLYLRALLEDFQAAGALPGNYLQALEWRHHDKALLLHHLLGFGIAFRGAVPGNDDLPAQSADALYLDGRSPLRHHHHRPGVEPAGGPGHRLAVV